MKLKVDVKGVKATKKELTDWKDSRVKALIQQVKMTGRAIRKDARRNAPKKTGRLRRGIKFFFKKSKSKGIAGFVRSTMPYSRIIENGSVAKGIPPRPFMQQAFDAHQREFNHNIELIMSLF
jgi:HK97 gp10 family phage protein